MKTVVALSLGLVLLAAPAFGQQGRGRIIERAPAAACGMGAGNCGGAAASRQAAPQSQAFGVPQPRTSPAFGGLPPLPGGGSPLGGAPEQPQFGLPSEMHAGQAARKQAPSFNAEIKPLGGLGYVPGQRRR